MRFSIPGDFNPRSPDGERPCSVPARSHSTLFQSTLPGWGATYSSVPAVSGTVFQSTLPGWGATRVGVTADAIQVEFQSTLPGWGATGVRHEQQRGDGISIHAPRMGSNVRPVYRPLFSHLFQSTLPGWGATISEPGLYRLVIFQSTLPGWGATWLLLWRLGGGRHFNPRSPDGERRGWETVPNRRSGFQSTLPGWGATAAAGVRVRGLWYFNPRSPDGERPLSRCAQYNRVIISIHAPRMGSDLFERVWRGSRLIFQSTLPGWGATRSSTSPQAAPRNFNPRSPDGERQPRNVRPRMRRNFNPRSPDGERPALCSSCVALLLFQSTLPGWGATR
ncbi:hypothetical protein NRBB51_1479 [Bifidobacterium breve]|uniref:Uncharacterized protein n=1 Tax=Bifidobacterium breve TaxID=1685 RepID=A0AAN1IB61_BIFBR|nr:hypothetical protein NRBB51_1479 [Bifidobacterium breve]